MSNDAEEFLFGGGGTAAKFEDIGDAVEGEIVDFDVQQQTSMETNEPLFWSNGKPRNQLIVTLQTAERQGEDDDGTRRIYAKGGNFEPAEGTGTSMKNAIADAVKKSGARFEKGGRLKIGMTGIGKRTNRGFAPPKLYRAVYSAPVKSVSAEELFES